MTSVPGSDTEVLLRAYAEWGENLAEHLDGMFAFAVWDEQAQKLLLVRDRLGVKPLFWAAVDGGLAFASEPKALFAHPEIRPRVDADGLREAYSLLFNTGPTVWSGIREVEPGGLLVLNRDGIRERHYRQLDITRPPELDLRIGEFCADTYRSTLAAVPHLNDETPAEHRQREMQHVSLTRWLRQLLQWQAQNRHTPLPATPNRRPGCRHGRRSPRSRRDRHRYQTI